MVQDLSVLPFGIDPKGYRKHLAIMKTPLINPWFMVTLQLRQLVLQPGQRLQVQEVSWSEFDAILHELGDKRVSRMAYSNGILEIRMPLLAAKLKGVAKHLKLFANGFRHNDNQSHSGAKGF